MSLHELIELLMNSIATLHKVVQTMLSITSILIEAPRDNLSECKVMGGGDEEGL